MKTGRCIITLLFNHSKDNKSSDSSWITLRMNEERERERKNSSESRYFHSNENESEEDYPDPMKRYYITHSADHPQRVDAYYRQKMRDPEKSEKPDQKFSISLKMHLKVELCITSWV